MKATTDNWSEVEAASKAALPQDVVEFIETRRHLAHSESHLIGVLHKVQERCGYLAREHIDAVAQLMQIPAAKVSGVATFYHFFKLTPQGKYVISVCLGTACYVNGGADILQRVQEELGVQPGETTKDGMFSLQVTRCLGTCGLGPVLMVNEEIHAKMTPERVPMVLSNLRGKTAKATA